MYKELLITMINTLTFTSICKLPGPFPYDREALDRLGPAPMLPELGWSNYWN